MNILITYFSETGNTAKVARAIYEETLSQGHKTDMRCLSDVVLNDRDNYKLIFVGSACHDTDVAKPVKRFLDALPSHPSFQLAGFVTHATYMPKESARMVEYYEAWAGRCLPTFQRVCENKGIPFLSYYHCQGAPSPGIAAFIHNRIVTDDDEWDTYIAEVMRHPDEIDLQNARVFTRDVLMRFKIE